MPGPTYVRGYLLGYAQLARANPADTVSRALARQPAAAESWSISPSGRLKAPKSSDHHVIKITTLVVAGLVLGLAAIWSRGRDDSPIRLSKPAATEVEAA